MTRYIQRGNPPLPHLGKERVDAIQWTGTNFDQLTTDFPETGARLIASKTWPFLEDPDYLAVTVTGGDLFLRVGWWLIRTGSSVHAMFPWAFEERYELEAP